MEAAGTTASATIAARADRHRSITSEGAAGPPLFLCLPD
jgi:hypothetical protein